LAGQTDDYRLMLAADVARRSFGADARAHYLEQAFYNWGSNRYSRGAYALYGIGQAGLMDVLAQPHGRVSVCRRAPLAQLAGLYGRRCANWRSRCRGRSELNRDFKELAKRFSASSLKF